MMELTATPSLLSLLLAASLVLFGLYRSARPSSSNSKRLPLPPGPPREPILGNARHVPSSAPWKVYTEWKKIYGDIVYTRIINQHNIVINSYRVAKEVMDRAVYSGRYSPVILDKLMGVNQGFVSINYGAQWRIYRRLMNPYMHKVGVGRYLPMQGKSTCWYLQTLLDHPEEFMENFKLKTAKDITRIVYGITEEGVIAQYISDADHVAKIFLRAILPGSFLVNTIPQLRFLPGWFPGMEFKRIAADGRKIYLASLNTPVERVKSKMVRIAPSPDHTNYMTGRPYPMVIKAEGTAEASITSQLLERGEDEDAVKKMNASIYSAAVETTVASMNSFMLAMTLHPEIVKKAQAELDSIVGLSRLPNKDDQERLPYLNAVFMEVLRWMPVVPLGIPHCLLEDDEYKEYFMPQGSIIHSNTWAMSRDETYYDSPDRFWPERFLKPGEEALDPRLYVFGLGRRACIGKHLAESSLFLVFASVLATFDIAKVRDKSGREIVPKVDFDARVKPFECSIKPRSAVTASLIRDAVAADS
ncbi:hypothetical protein BOTBODRAFT_31924 [Botryobasidium botryosum FD-172 SS1]|uniref:Cytochrome P450 n=1 Tax=Botryobasidium botryosum (strain FD-172 SS1) TaxID=930990 RepID=A0A067MTU1_BOTB1|nr:hypothetical protein BOTBODRAFT_31924 [Botryobasidium botryosum FD-172 SS1]